MSSLHLRPKNTYGYLSCSYPGDRERLIAMLETGFEVGQLLAGDLIEATIHAGGFFHADECINAYGEYISLRAKKHFGEAGARVSALTGDTHTSFNSDYVTLLLDDLVALNFQFFAPGRWSVFAALLPDNTMRIRSAIFGLEVNWGQDTETYTFDGEYGGSWKHNPAMSVSSVEIA